MANGILDNNEKEPELEGFRGLLGNLIVPGLGATPTRKQLIDAAILRGSLELLKPKQPGQSTANVFANALTAAGETAKSFQPDLDQQMKALEVEQLRRELEGKEEVIERPVTDRNLERDALADQAFGIGDATALGLGGIGRFFGQDPFSETKMSVANIEGLNRDLLKGAASEVTGRPSVYYLELSQDELPTPGTLGSTDADALRKYETLQERFRGQLSKNKKALKSAESRGDKTKIYKIQQAIADQEYFVNRLDGVTRSLRESLGQGPTVETDFSVTKPVNDENINTIFNNWETR